MIALVFSATWILLAGGFFFGGLRGKSVPFTWLFWTTSLKRGEDGAKFWFVLACWFAMFLLACYGLLLTGFRAMTGAHPFDRDSFWPGSIKDVLVFIFFSLIFVGTAWIIYRNFKIRQILCSTSGDPDNHP